MEVVVTPHVDSYAANWLVGQWEWIDVLGLATGNTPENLYGWLVQHFYDGNISFKDKTTFNLDEYYTLPPNHPQSYRATIHRQLIQYVDLPAENFRVPPGLTEDVEASSEAYEKAIEQAGGIDVWILGIGQDGHIAFNESPSEQSSRTRLIDLAESTIQHNARFFNSDLYQVPRQAITVGVATILEARKLLLIAKGDEKAKPVAEAIMGEQTPKMPASWLQDHKECVVVLDHAAASGLLTQVADDAKEIESASGRKHTLSFAE